jgi:TonB family protein
VVNSDWLDIDVLEDYLDGKLNAKMMNKVERVALEDPFVAQALAGLSQSPKRSIQSLSLLQKQLDSRIAQQQETKTKSVVTWQRLSIAAAAAVIFVAVSIMFWMRENNTYNQSAKQSKTVEVNLDPAHTLDDAKPVSGWASFFTYLRKNNRLIAQGKVGQAVELSFTVDGQGKPQNIQVLKSPGKKYTDESVRLLQEGPAWRIPTGPVKTIRLKIEF